MQVLNRFAPKPNFTCEEHEQWGMRFALKPIINIFFKNKEKLLNDTVRKDGVAAFKKLKRKKNDN